MGKLQQGLAMVATGLALTGCGENAEAKDENPLKLAEVAAVIPETQADCLKLELETQSAVMQCMRDVTARDSAIRQSEIADKQDLRSENAENLALEDQAIVEVDENLADITEERDKVTQQINVLSEVLEVISNDQPSQ